MQKRLINGRYSYNIASFNLGWRILVIGIIWYFMAIIMSNSRTFTVTNEPTKVSIVVVEEQVPTPFPKNAVNCPATRETLRGILINYPHLKNKEELLMKQIWLESRCLSNQRGDAGEIGIAQFMPGTARSVGLKVGNGIDERHDYKKSLTAMVKLMDRFYWKYNGDWEKMLIAYNAGEGKVHKPPKASIYYVSRILH